jgi:hypothetical protein
MTEFGSHSDLGSPTVAVQEVSLHRHAGKGGYRARVCERSSSGCGSSPEGRASLPGYQFLHSPSPRAARVRRRVARVARMVLKPSARMVTVPGMAVVGSV